MPGKKNQRGSFMSAARLLREVVEADTDPADVTEFISASSLNDARQDVIHASIIVPATITKYDIVVYSDAVASMTKLTPAEVALKTLVEEGTDPADRWAIFDGLIARKRSSFITLDTFYPATNIKILLQNVEGDFSGGSAFILYGISE